MMTPGKLDDGLKISEGLPDGMGRPGEPGSDPMNMIIGDDGRNLSQEEQQFADLLHGRDQSAGVSINSPPFEPSTGRWTESPFSIAGNSFKKTRQSDDADDLSRPPEKQESKVETDAATEFSSAPAAPAPVSPMPEPLQGRIKPGLIERIDPPSDRFSAGAGVRFEGEPKPTNDSALTTPATQAEPATDDYSSRPKAAEEPGQSIPVQPSGDRILQGFLGQPSAPAPLATPSPPSGSTRIDRIEQLAERLAERVLVSDRTHAADSEVRIQLRESVLQGAEIMIRRDQGQLVVSFNGVDARLAQQLSPQTDDLQRALATRLDTSVRIEVNVSSGETGGQGSSGDGRSRNRRDPRDEWGADY